MFSTERSNSIRPAGQNAAAPKANAARNSQIRQAIRISTTVPVNVFMSAYVNPDDPVAAEHHPAIRSGISYRRSRRLCPGLSPPGDRFIPTRYRAAAFPFPFFASRLALAVSARHSTSARCCNDNTAYTSPSRFSVSASNWAFKFSIWPK